MVAHTNEHYQQRLFSPLDKVLLRGIDFLIDRISESDEAKAIVLVVCGVALGYVIRDVIA
jgi:hypothetical protein